jgi:hypothetical protein
VDADGFVGYWVDDAIPSSVPSTTSDGKLLVILSAANLDVLQIRTLEFVALTNIKKTAKELQTDGVARKEVNYRLQEAEEFLDETLNLSFSIGVNQQCWIQGHIETLNNITDFNSKLSDICDRVYHRSPILWNELINRRDLTSQGAKARRELIQAMLEHQYEERLGLEGYGPEVSVYYSLLEETGIHRQEDENWDFYPPSENSGLNFLWEAVENFCLAATEKSQSFDLLYQHLEMSADESAIAILRDQLQNLLQAGIPDLVVNGDLNHRLSGNLHISIPDIPNSAIIARVRHQLAISGGAACSSGAIAPSHVLQAMNLSENIIEGALRIGIGKFTTTEEIEKASSVIICAVNKIHQLF